MLLLCLECNGFVSIYMVWGGRHRAHMWGMESSLDSVFQALSLIAPAHIKTTHQLFASLVYAAP